MKLDTRLYFIKDPHIFIPLFLFIGLIGITFKIERNESKPKVEEQSTPIVKKDTTEWRKQYYEHLYNSK